MEGMTNHATIESRRAPEPIAPRRHAPGNDPPGARRQVARLGVGPGREAGHFVMGVDGKNARRLTPLDSEADEPSWSPDGRRIVYVSTRDGFRELYVMNADGSGNKRVTFQRCQIHSPAWSPYRPGPN